MTEETARPSRFTRNLHVRCPAVLPTAVETAAERQCMTSSEYVRRSVVERLKADGIDPVLEVAEMSGTSAQQQTQSSTTN